MRIGIVGGKLQGLEACYLSQKAGYEVLLIDRNKECVASGLADIFCCLDVLKDNIEDRLRSCDVCLPAIEDIEVLNRLEAICEQVGCLYIYDRKAYMTASSKICSNRFFAELGLLIPSIYPNATFPLIGKPSDQSGSQGVCIIHNEKELEAWKRDNGDNCVLQQYIEGPSYSIEVIGNGRTYRAYQVTEIITDNMYDCSRVEADVDCPVSVIAKMTEIGETIGNALKINGIFDVETILGNDGNMYLLEIDARLPSQTPSAIYHSSGINFVEILCRQMVKREELPIMPEDKKNVVYHNIFVNKVCGEDGKYHVSVTNPGEHQIGQAGAMTVIPDFFGADEAITNYKEGCESFLAILIFSGEKDMVSVQQKCEETVCAIKKAME